MRGVGHLVVNSIDLVILMIRCEEDKCSGISIEVFFVGGDHGVDVSSFSFEESDFCFEVFYFFG